MSIRDILEELSVKKSGEIFTTMSVSPFEFY